jgi:acyl dehydratase
MSRRARYDTPRKVQLRRVLHMPLEASLVGHVTRPISGTIEAADIRRFADAIGDTNPLFHDLAAAQPAGFAAMPAPPTFVTRFRIPFAEAGLDPEHSQVLHAEQEYEYTRPLVAGQALEVRHHVASIRQTARMGNMAIMTLEQLGDTAEGERIFTGRATVIVRDAPPEGAAAAAAPAAGQSKGRPAEPAREQIPPLTKHVTQEQINAYAEVSGDHNPIHVNPEVARAVGLDGTIAHGMLSMAFLGQMLTDWLASRETSTGWVARLRVRFQGMVRPGDTLTCRGALGEPEDGRQRLEVWVANQDGERVLSGDAEVTR